MAALLSAALEERISLRANRVISAFRVTASADMVVSLQEATWRISNSTVPVAGNPEVGRENTAPGATHAQEHRAQPKDHDLKACSAQPPKAAQRKQETWTDG